MTNFAELTFRPVQETDRSHFINLARLAFTPTVSAADAEQERRDQPLNSIGQKGWVVADATGNLVARYRQLDLSLWLAGVCLPLAGVGGVAVSLEQRGQGIARWMLEQALKEFRTQQTPISMLYPFQHGFYRRLGWAWTGKTYQYRVASQHLPLYSERRYIKAYTAEQEELKTVYDKAAQRQNGWLQRQSWHWEQFFKPKGGRELYQYIEAGELLGYVVLEFKRLEATKDQLAIVVQEWVALTPQAYRGIVGFLASLRDQVTTIVWNTYASDPFPHLLKEQRQDPALTSAPFEFNLTHGFGAIGGGFMWRFVDIKRAFELRPIAPGMSFKLKFHIVDPVFGVEQFTVEFEQGQMQVMSPNQPSSTVLKLSVEHLMQLFCGMRRSRDLLWTGELELEGDRSLLPQLDAAWASDSPFCWDFF